MQGAGEALRGGLMAAADRIFGDSEGAARNEEIARKGEEEMREGISRV